MMEILRMWRMVRILKKHGATWNNQLIRIKVAQELTSQYGKDPRFNSMVEQESSREIIVKNNRQSRATRKALAISYIQWSWSRWFRGDVILLGKGVEEKITKAQDIIQTCIDEPYRFMNEETGDDPFHSPLIYLTTKGKDFSGLIGLYNEIITKVEPIATKSKIIWGAFGLIFGSLMTFLLNLLKS